MASNNNSKSSLVLMTFVGRTEGAHRRHNKRFFTNIAKTVRSSLPSNGRLYSICEHFDTYQKGGLYPELHICKDAATIKQVVEEDDFLDASALGGDCVVDQALYREVELVEPDTCNARNHTVIAVAAFRSIENTPNSDLLVNWKSWTGARPFLLDILEAGLDCHRMTFYVRQQPQLSDEDAPGFFYILITEIGIKDPGDDALAVDVLQRFRVERWFGYQTIYKRCRH